ncbi:hypothetical protein SALBM311S_03164 [Streptomyces alboniger]
MPELTIPPPPGDDGAFPAPSGTRWLRRSRKASCLKPSTTRIYMRRRSPERGIPVPVRELDGHHPLHQGRADNLAADAAQQDTPERRAPTANVLPVDAE